MMLLIKNGHIVDPSQKLDKVMDILVEEGKIVALEENITPPDNAEIYDAKGLLVTPGLIDVHIHLREPGLEAKEDIVSGTQAAAAGGFTTVACMPNTRPSIDNSIVVSGLLDRIAKEGKVKVEIVGAISKEQKGEELSEMGDMSLRGVMAFSDDGRFVDNAKLFSSALEYASIFDKIIISHAEETALGHDGFMHEGAVSAKLGIPGVPSTAEDIAVARDIILAEYTKSKLHIAHVSTKGAVELIRAAKKRGVQVTAEAAVHHLTLTDAAVIGYNTATKVSPPLRSQDHVDAMRAGILDNTIDAIVTDHAPHAFEEKDVEFRYAPNGFSGLETSVGVLLTELVHKNIVSLTQIISKMTFEPAKIFKLDRGTLTVGSVADITILDINKEWTVDSKKFYTRGKHTPYEAKNLKGKAVATIVNGNFVMKDGVVC